MSAFYERAGATSVRLISEKGQDVTLTHTVAGAYDPDTQTTGAPTVSSWTVKAVETSLALFAKEGTLIQAGDKGLLMSPKDTSGAAIAPENGFTVTMAGNAWHVERSRPLSPGGTPLLFTLLLR